MSFKKKTNIIFVVFFLLISISVGLLNYFVDPYEMKNIKANTFRIFQVPREMIYTYINQTKKIKFDSVVIGGSSAGMVFFPELFYRDTNENIAALPLEGLSPKEIYDMLDYMLKIHPEIKKVYVSIEPLQYAKCFEQSTVLNKPTTYFQDFTKLYYSLETTILSFEKLKKLEKNEKKEEEKKEQLDDRPIIPPDDVVSFYINRKIKYVKEHCADEHCEYLNIPYIEKTKKLLDEKKLEIKVFVLPVNVLFLSDLLHNNRLNDFENLKREIVRVYGSYYDMTFLNKHTVDKFKFLWRDTIHLSPFLNPYIFEILAMNREYPEIAEIYTRENIEEKILNQRILLEKYIEDNKSYVDNYVLPFYDITKDEGYTEPRYFSDIPEPYKTRFFTEYQEYINLQQKESKQ